MKDKIDLQMMLSKTSSKRQQTTSFALLCLGIIDPLSSGLMNTSDVIQLFFHAENCLYIQKNLNEKAAREIMSRGAQLHDLFDTLPVAEAQQEFQRELTTMHALCLKLLQNEQIAA